MPGTNDAVRTSRALRASLLLLLAMWLTRQSLAQMQTTQYVQAALTDTSGLPQNSVSSIAQTSDGYLWFGTEEGLGRFDGIRTSVFDHQRNKDLPDNYVSAITSAEDGALWVGTRGDLSRYRDGVFTRILHVDHPINDLFESSTREIWVATAGCLYSINGGSVRRYGPQDGLRSANITSVAQTRDGTMWFGSANGLIRFREGRFETFTSKEGLPSDSVLRVAGSHDGSVWLATPAGLAHWNGKLLRQWVVSQKTNLGFRVSSLLEDRKGVLWVGYDHQGLAFLHNGSLIPYTSSNGLPSNDVSRIFEDRDGHLWIGLSSAGVVELRHGLFSTVGRREGLPEDMIWSVLKAHDGTTWIGTNSQGVSHLYGNGKVRTYSRRDGLPEGSIYGLCEGADGTIWIGSEHGVLSRLKNGIITNYRDTRTTEGRLAAILEGSEGELWLCFHSVDGLVRFREGRFEHFAVSGLPNTAVLATDGSIWLGTDHGGASRLHNGVVQTFTTDQGLLSNFVQAVYVDRQGVTWLGSSPGGLNRIEDGRVTTYTVEQGLFDMTVGAIAEDNEGNLWMTCNKGIFRVPKQELNDFAKGKIKRIHSVTYGLSDGMRSAECNFGATPSISKGQDGHLSFATVRGVASIDPRQDQLRTAVPSPLIEATLLNEKRVPHASQGLHSDPGSSDLEIQYTAPNYDSPESINFRYRLVGFDSDWIDAGTRRQAFYTRVPPGSYSYQLQAEPRNGAWGGATTLQITVLPHFWQTNWFRMVCFIVVLLAALFIHKVRTRFLIRQTIVLEARVLQRTEALEQATYTLKQAHHALHEQATKDSLTGLLNRQSIFEIAQRSMEEALMAQKTFCVMMADVDHFKLINDNYGHQFGDVALRMVAQRLQGLLLPSEALGRYGGEEFLFIFPGCSFLEGLRRAEQMRASVQSMTIRSDNRWVNVTCSFGVASSETFESLDQITESADQALYKAKRDGRNCVRAGLEILVSDRTR